jgi:hypothetical protein
MVKEVDLSSYWMPVLRQIKEFQELAHAEEPELVALLGAAERTISDMFIPTAGEDGIKRLEDMLGVTPSADDSLITRRSRLMSMWGNKAVYTTKTLKDLLASYCGDGNYELIERYREYILEIIASLPARGSMEALHSILLDIIPCNQVLVLKNVLKESGTAGVYIGGAVSTANVYTVACEDPRIQESVTIEMPLYGAVAGSVGVVVTVHSDKTK